MRKRTRRKVYKLMNPITLAIEGACVSEQEKLDQLRIRELAAIDAFARGHATEGSWHDVFALTTICREMAVNKVGPEALEACDRAVVAMDQDMERFRQTGKMGTTGQGLQAYRDVFQYHDIQRQSIARSEYEKYINKCISRLRFGKPS